MAHRTENHSDLTLFKNRLWKLMEEKNIYTTKELAKMLYNQKLVTVKQKDSYDEPSKIYGNAIGAIDKKIQKHLNSDTTKELQGEFVTAYCTFFGCSSDYLFGFIDCKNHDNQFIHDKTGLSELAINQLIHFSSFSSGENTVQIIDYFIRHGRDMIEAIKKIYEHKRNYDICERTWKNECPPLTNDSIYEDEEITNKRNLIIKQYKDAKIMCEVAPARAIGKFETLINKMIDDFYTNGWK